MLPMQIAGNEAWNAFHVDRLRAGLALYPSASDLIANNYPPLSFLLVGGLSQLGADPIMIGRALSLLATLIATAGIASIARTMGCRWPAATVGAFWYLATMTRFFDSYVGVNDPNLVGIAMMVVGLAWALQVQTSGKGWIELPFALMAVAGFYKNTLFAIPLASWLWLLRCDRSLALRAGVSGAAVAAAGLLLCIHVFGGNFTEQVTAPRLIEFDRLIRKGGQLQWIAPALVLWAFWTCFSGRGRRVEFTFILVVMGLLGHIWQQVGDGLDINSQFELVVALAVALAIAFEFPATTRLLPLTKVGARILLVAVLIGRLVLVTRLEPYFLIFSADFRQLGTAVAATMDAEIARVAAMPGNVSCSNMTVCRAARKAFVFDGFAVRQRLQLGLMSEESLCHAVAANGLSFTKVDPNADVSVLRNAADIASATVEDDDNCTGFQTSIPCIRRLGTCGRNGH